MSRDIRPRRRQEDWDPATPHDPEQEAGETAAPPHGSDTHDLWRGLWHVSPSRRQHRMPDEHEKKTGFFRETLFDIHPSEEEDPERWDGLS